MDPSLPTTAVIAKIILNALSFNYAQWRKQLNLVSHKYGATGMAINADELTTPLLAPTVDDINALGKPLYAKDEDGELTSRAFATYNNDIRRFDTISAAQIINDDAALTFILDTIHPTSRTIISNLDKEFKAYLKQPLGNRATAYLHLIKLTHSTSDAATKNNRTLQYFSSHFEDDMTTTIDNINSRATQFLNDFGSSQHQGMVEANVIHCFILTQGISDERYRNLQDAIYFAQNSLELATDPIALAAFMTRWDLTHRHAYTTDSPSSQGQSFLSKPIAKPLPNKSALKNPKSTPLVPDKTKPHCRSCFLRLGKIYNNHGVPGKAACSHHASTTASPTIAPTFARAPPTTPYSYNAAPVPPPHAATFSTAITTPPQPQPNQIIESALSYISSVTAEGPASDAAANLLGSLYDACQDPANHLYNP